MQLYSTLFQLSEHKVFRLKVTDSTTTAGEHTPRKQIITAERKHHRDMLNSSSA
jgi:hypothetical protein